MIPIEPIEAALARVIERIPQSRVGAAMRYALEGGGKRLRPALVVACYEAVAARDADDRVAALAAALEIIHTYSLVHDDLPCMDDDDMRRGRSTTHRQFDVRTATLAGASLIPLAFEVAAEAAQRLELPQDDRARIAHALAEAAGANGMVGGQVLDLEGDASSAALPALERIHSAKTGALLQGACRIGAIAAGADARHLAALDDYGRHLGMAFQITDDILDETASTEQLGKTAGKDRSVSKATFPAVLGPAGAAERALTEVEMAVRALVDAELPDPTLIELCRFAVERKR